MALLRRQWHPTPVLLPGKSHGWRSLVGCSPWGRWGSDTTERLHFHFSLSCIGEGNGNPLQCSCLENPRDGVAQSRTRLKRLSSSSSSSKVSKAVLQSSRKTSISALLTMPSLWLCGSQSTVENSERDGNIRPPNLPLEKSVCKSGSNS